MSRTLFTWKQLQTVTGGTWRGPLAVRQVAGQRGICDILSDSRAALPPGTLFLALVGENFDGHKFVEAAAEKGAAAVLVSRLTPEQEATLTRLGVPALVVRDTLAAYQALAGYHRRRFKELIVVGVTGSSGKTSTKEIIGSVLTAHFNGAVLLSRGNTNNQVGVPQNLLRLTRADRAAVIEMGTNAPGEILPLATMAQPTISVLTNVGPVHLERLGSVDGVTREKSDIFVPLAATGGWAVVPAALAQHPQLTPRLPAGRVVTFGATPDAEVQVTYEQGDLAASQCVLRRRGEAPFPFQWRLIGAHQATNAAAAFAVARILGIPDDAAARALATCRLPGHRQECSVRAGVTWLNDAYNANPASMRALIEVLAGLRLVPGATLYLVVGDMWELGPDEDRYHHEVLATAQSRLPAGSVVLPVGTRMTRAAAPLGLTGVPDRAAAQAHLFPLLRPGDLVALKASHGMRLYELLSEPAK